MIPCLIAGCTAFIAVTLTAMNVFAWRAGEKRRPPVLWTTECRRLTRGAELTGQAIAQASTSAPRTREELIDALGKEEL